MKRHLAACLIAVCGTTAAAQDLVFVATLFDNTNASDPGTAADPFKDISAFSSATTDFRIGNNPTVCAYDGANLYVGGIVNGPTTVEDPNNPGTFIDLTMEIAEISDFFGTAGAKDVLGSQTLAENFIAFSGRGYSGLDWDDTYGLLATRDFGSVGATGDQVLLFQRNDPMDFNAQLQVGALGIRGISGPAYDFGFDGSGFPLVSGMNGPAAAIPIFTAGRAFGLDPTTFDPADDLYGFDFSFPGDTSGNPLYTFFCNSTTWRDFDIHPDTGLIVARANNGLVIAERTSTNGTTTTPVCVTPPKGLGNAVVQPCEILHNTACGVEAIAMIDRPDPGSFSPFQQTVLFYDFQGNQLSYSIELPDGSLAPLDTGNPANLFGLHWHEESQTLFVIDGQNRDVYALTLKCESEFQGVCCFACDPAPVPGACPDASGMVGAVACQDVADLAACEALGGTYRDGLSCADAIDPCQCPADLNGDGNVDVFDFGDLAANFGNGAPDCATRAEGDLNCDGVIDVFDFGDLAADFGCVSD
jgi:hypothetical protein